MKLLLIILICILNSSAISATFSDDVLSFHCDRDLHVQRVHGELLYIIALDQEDGLILKVRGPAEPEEFAKQRVVATIKAAKTAAAQKDDSGAITRVGHVSEPFKIDVGNGTFWFTKSETTATSNDGTSTTSIGYSGFGSHAGRSLMIQLTVDSNEDQIEFIRKFIMSLKFKKS